MLYIIHGDDHVSSRNKLSQITQEFKNVSVLDAEKVAFPEIIQAMSTNDLFVDKRCVVVEKVLKLSKKDSEKLQELISKKDKETTLVLWHNTELSKIFLSKYKNAVVASYMLPKLFFTFLDNMSPRNLKQELETLSKMEKVEAEQVFYALVKRIRQLFFLKSNVNSEEIVKMNPWQLSKLQSQSATWTLDKLSRFSHSLFEIEVKMKSGGLVLPLRKELDRLLIQELN